jgi:hypothetical protein
MIIDVWSDVVCPWCFIGRRRLQRALQATEIEAEVHHRAFQLQPDWPTGVVTPTKELLQEKYGLDEKSYLEMHGRVNSIAAEEGLHYKLGGTLSGNTRDAHRLLLWAQSQHQGEALLESMYSGYFEQELPLFTEADLLPLVASAGLDTSKASEILHSSAFDSEVNADVQLAAQLGANGVPFFVIDMKYGISGAQPLEAFTSTLQRARSDSE